MGLIIRPHPPIGRPARKVLVERLPPTLQLAGAAFLLSMIVGIPLGILSAIKLSF